MAKLKVAVIGLGRIASTIDDEIGKYQGHDLPYAHIACHMAVPEVEVVGMRVAAAAELGDDVGVLGAAGAQGTGRSRNQHPGAAERSRDRNDVQAGRAAACHEQALGGVDAVLNRDRLDRLDHLLAREGQDRRRGRLDRCLELGRQLADHRTGGVEVELHAPAQERLRVDVAEHDRRVGDGWLVSSATPEEIKEGCEILFETANEFNREIEDDHIGVLMGYYISDDVAGATEKAEKYVTRHRPDAHFTEFTAVGPVDKVAEMIQSYVDAGGSKFVVRPLCPAEESMEQLDILGEDLLPMFPIKR